MADLSPHRGPHVADCSSQLIAPRARFSNPIEPSLRLVPSPSAANTNFRLSSSLPVVAASNSNSSAVKSGTSWPLPLYELALLSAARARALGVRTEITLLSPEQRPLAVFGAEASELVATELTDRGVRFLGASTPGSVCGGGALTVQPGSPIKADRVVAVPQLRGARIAGIPANRSGFVPTDALGRVEGMPDVYAAGDTTAYPIKHGGLATQQADRIAHMIAAGLGLTPHEVKPKPILEVRLIGGQRPLRLRIELDEFGQPAAATLAHTRRETQPSVSKVYGRYLTPYLETRQPPPPTPPTHAP